MLFVAVGLCVSIGPSKAVVSSVRGSACGYFVNVGLFGGPQMRRGCGQAVDAPAAGASPEVTLPASGSASPITADDPDGATAQYGPARIFAGRWPEHIPSAPPSGPISVRTQGTVGGGGSVTSSVDIVLRNPPNADSPGGFGPGPVEGDELHSTCSASESGVTGSVRFVNGLLSTATDAGGSPTAQEDIPANPPPNYTRHGVITNVGDVFSVVFNEQIRNGDGSLTVNGFHMYLFGPVAVVVVAPTVVTTPAWVVLVVVLACAVVEVVVVPGAVLDVVPAATVVVVVAPPPAWVVDVDVEVVEVGGGSASTVPVPSQWRMLPAASTASNVHDRGRSAASAASFRVAVTGRGPFWPGLKVR